MTTKLYLLGIFEFNPIFIRVWILFSHFTSRSNSSCVCTVASRKYVIRPIRAERKHSTESISYMVSVKETPRGGKKKKKITTYESCIPFVDNLCECRWTWRHKNLSHTILKHLHVFIVNTQKSNCCPFLGLFVLQIPNTISCIAECLLAHSYLWQYTNLKSAPTRHP